MRILVAGATGFVGAHTTRLFKDEGHEVWAFSRDPVRAQRFPTIDRAFRWDGTSGRPPAEAFAGVDAVVNVAGDEPIVSFFAPLRPSWRRNVWASRVDLTRHLVDALLEHGGDVASFANVSAVGWYGDQGEDVLTEPDGPGTGTIAQLCAEWETEAARAGDAAKVSMLRFGVVTGPRLRPQDDELVRAGPGGAMQMVHRLAKLRAHGRIGNGRQWWPWVHVRDVAGIVDHVLQEGMEGPVNVTAPQPARQIDLARETNDVLGVTTGPPAPGFAMRALFGAGASVLLWSQKVLPARVEKSGYVFQYPELRPALEDTFAGNEAT